MNSRQTGPEFMNNNGNKSQVDNKKRSFTQLLRRASSRGSHNTPNIEETKDEPTDFNSFAKIKPNPTV